MPEQETQNKPTLKERMKEITDQIEQGIRDVFSSEKYKQYLSTMARFPSYSPNNVMLIYLQKPDASLVAGFNKWQTSFGRHVKKGERGIRIIAPVAGKRRVKEQARDPLTDELLRDDNGDPLTVESEQSVVNFRPVTVFDVSQTSGKPLPTIGSDLKGNVEQYREFVEALRRSSPVPISFARLDSNTDGMFRIKEHDILIRAAMSEVQTVDAIIHEITHARLHDPNRTEPRPQWKVVMVGGDGSKKDYRGGFDTKAAAQALVQSSEGRVTDENNVEWRLEVERDADIEIKFARDTHTREVEAESVAYTVCQYYGIQTGDNSFPYIAGWSADKTLPELKTSLQTIRKTAYDLIVDIDRNFRAVCKERGIVPKVAENNPVREDPAAVPERQDTGFYLVDGNTYLHVQAADDGWDYTTYDAKTHDLLDGGRMTDTEISLSDAVPGICEMAGLPGKAVEQADPALLDALQQQERARWEKMYAEQQTPAPRRYEVGTDGTVQRTYNGKTPDQFTAEDVQAFMADTDAALRRAQPDYAKDFFDGKEDGYLIYQTKSGVPYQFVRFEDVAAHGNSIQLSDYNAVYTGPMPENTESGPFLNELFERFNIDRPADFTGRSMSVSDIIAIRKDGVVSCYYVDGIGFQPLPDLALPENYLKNAEISTEDDCNMIDGVINNGPKPPTLAELEYQASHGQPVSVLDIAAAASREQRTSVLGKLKSQPGQTEHKPAKPQKHQEKEL